MVRGSGGVDPARAAAGVGQCAVFAGAVVADLVAADQLFTDRDLDVVTDGSYVERGRQVRIIEMSGNRIVVREVDE